MVTFVTTLRHINICDMCVHTKRHVYTITPLCLCVPTDRSSLPLSCGPQNITSIYIVAVLMSRVLIH